MVDAEGGVEDAREEIILVGSGASAGGDGELSEVSLTWPLPWAPKGPAAAAAHLRVPSGFCGVAAGLSTLIIPGLDTSGVDISVWCSCFELGVVRTFAGGEAVDADELVLLFSGSRLWSCLEFDSLDLWSDSGSGLCLGVTTFNSAKLSLAAPVLACSCSASSDACDASLNNSSYKFSSSTKSGSWFDSK